MAIQILDQNTINKIAAGEVIERPSSVVKELVENAIDAKATAITVEIKDGGISFIRVTDNGCGIDKSELPMAFLRHSTSKIKSVEDLMCVTSLGFRGEALSSIAAVAQVELITKTKPAFSGARYVIEGGHEVSIEEVGAPEGTTFIVRNLFYNTPVRRKFLKTAVTEAGYVSGLIEHLAFSHPEISFRFINNNQNKLHTSGNGNLKDIIYHVNGRDITANLLEISRKTQDIEISGFIGKPMISRGNRMYENYFINGRYIKSNIITRAIEEAYKGYIMAHQYPFTALHFTINQEIIDVNVHPTKMELRFSKNEYVYDFVLNAVRDALSHRELIPEVRFDDKKEKMPSQPMVQNTVQPMAQNTVQPTVQNTQPRKMPEPQPRMPEPFEVRREAQQKEYNEESRADRICEETPAYNAAVNAQYVKTPDIKGPDIKTPDIKVQIEKNISINQQIAKQEHMSLFDAVRQKSGESHQDEAAVPKPKLIGQIFDTYWLIEYDDKLFIMDQHAAHEKILYEKTMHLLEEKQMDTQMITPPVILSLNLREKEILSGNLEVFEKLGFEIESFGGNEYKVTGMPASLPNLNDKALLIEILDSLVEDGGLQKPELIVQKVASMSCKAAVKGNMKMSPVEAQKLIEQLMKADNPYNCPHGRPTLISMSKYEIERKFKRIV